MLRVLASWPSTSANCLLVLLLRWGFDRERVEDMSLLAILLLVLGLARASSQLGSLSVEMILRPEMGKTVWPGWIVLEGDLRDDQSL